MQFTLGHHETADGVAVIAFAGRLMLGPEGAQVEALVKKLLASGVRRFLFDFTELSHVDSTGIGRCIAALNLIMQAGGTLHVGGATGQVRDAFRVTQLDRVFVFFDDVNAAKAALAK